MARVRSLEKGTQNVRPHPTTVDCHYQVVTSEDGPLLHLTPFGSDDRASAMKSSQTLQLDEAMAGELLNVLFSTFPNLKNESTSYSTTSAAESSSFQERV